MKTINTLLASERLADKLILTGIHLDLTPALRQRLADKVARLLRHEPRIDRIRLDLENDKTKGPFHFVAKGRIEIPGPDLIASVDNEDAYKAIDLLVDKLDAALRRRSGKKIGPRNDPHKQLVVAS
jgi:putative sigma-54 modulation protein